MAIVKGKLEVLDINITRSGILNGKYIFSNINNQFANKDGVLNLTKMGLLPRFQDVHSTESTEFFWYNKDALNIPDLNEYAHAMSIKSVNMTTVITFNDKGQVLYKNKKEDAWDDKWTPLATESYVVDTVNEALNGGVIDLSNYYKKSESDNKFMNRVGNIIIQNGTDFPMITYAGSSKIKGGILYNKGEFHIWDQLADGTERYRVKVPTKSGTLLLQGDVYSKDDVDTKFLPTSGGTLTGAFGISTGDYSGLTLYNKTNHLRVEGNPDNSNYMLTLAYRNSDGSNKFVMQIPKGNSVLASQTWVDGIYYKKGTSPEFRSVAIQDGTVKELRIEKSSGHANQFQLATSYNNTWRRIQIPYADGTMALQEDIYNRSSSDARYFMAGRTDTVTSPEQVEWNSKSGIYNQAYGGFSEIVLHFNQGTGSSTPALQLRAQYSNRGLYYRTSTDASGFQVNWSKIFTSSHPPTATEVGAYSKTESDAKFALDSTALKVGTGGQLDVFKYNTNGHGYMAWVEQGRRQAYIGFGSAGTNAFTIANERGTASTINLTAGNILANGNTIATQIWSNSNHYTKAESDGKYQLKGNFVTVGTSYTKAESDGKYALKSETSSSFRRMRKIGTAKYVRWDSWGGTEGMVYDQDLTDKFLSFEGLVSNIFYTGQHAIMYESQGAIGGIYNIVGSTLRVLNRNFPTPTNNLTIWEYY